MAPALRHTVVRVGRLATVCGRVRTVDRHGGDSLEALLANVASGDPTAFDALYDRIAGVVFGVVVRVVRDPSLSEEVSQEVLVDVWNHASRFDPAQGSARAWIATIAHRRAVDGVRSTQSSRNRADVYGRALAFTTEPDPVADSAVRDDEHSGVRSALDALTPPQREVIELAYFHGLTYREVADRLATPLGTVKSRMREGLRRMRSTLGDADG